MKTVRIYTDGACSGNPGPGGWAAVLLYKQSQKELSGGDPLTTNNRMELTAAIEGLSALNESCAVTLYSDSKYLIDSVQKGWARGWQANNWIKPDKKPALNGDLWEQLLSMLDRHRVTLVWVKGHDGDVYNERCDTLAVQQSILFSTKAR